jgi:prepilin-type N-terminal cleavage/methylation domain-containing protein
MSIRGFTLFEFIVVTAIICILTLTTLPSFNNFLLANRASTTANSLFTALSYTRDLAIANQVGIKFAPLQSNDWQNGQVAVNENGKILRKFDALRQNDTLIWNSSLSKNNYIEYFADGTTNGQSGTFIYCPKGHVKYAYALIISETGHVRITNQLTDEQKRNCS